ncbi:MAG: MBL fold metallo-hydrolase [Deltaproteobacteria bacterium]|nr:MBL fold metallo-hydrolase [Deltaproteobacteria bacterium]
MRRLLRLVVGLVLVGALGLAALWRSPALQDAVLRQVIPRLIEQRGNALLADDALRVALCGSDAPLPHPTRAKACVAVFAAGKLWVVDTGPQSWNRLALMRVDGKHIGAVLYTHFHSDHIAELGELNLQTWAAGRPEPLRVYGPPGVERVVAGFQEAYALDTSYRVAHHGADLLPPAIERMRALPVVAPPGAKPVTVLEEGGLVVTAFPVNHEPATPAYGYRFDYRGRSVVVSGDTAKSPALIAAAHGADVLVHEAQANHLIAMIGEAAAGAGRDRVARIMRDIPSYHATPVEAAESANEAGVRLLVMYHLNPPPPNALVAKVFLRGVADVRPEGWILGDDGTLVTLPAASNEVVVGVVRQ